MSHSLTLEPFENHSGSWVFLEALERSYDVPLGPAQGTFGQFAAWLFSKPSDEVYTVMWDGVPVGVFALSRTTLPELFGEDAWATTTLLVSDARGKGINTVLKTAVAYGFSRVPATLYSVVRSANGRSLAAIRKLGAAHLVKTMDDGRNFFIYDNFDVSAVPVCPVQEVILGWYGRRSVPAGTGGEYGVRVSADVASAVAGLVTETITVQYSDQESQTANV